MAKMDYSSTNTNFIDPLKLTKIDTRITIFKIISTCRNSNLINDFLISEFEQTRVNLYSLYLHRMVLSCVVIIQLEIMSYSLFCRAKYVSQIRKS